MGRILASVLCAAFLAAVPVYSHAETAATREVLQEVLPSGYTSWPAYETSCAIAESGRSFAISMYSTSDTRGFQDVEIHEFGATTLAFWYSASEDVDSFKMYFIQSGKVKSVYDFHNPLEAAIITDSRERIYSGVAANCSDVVDGIIQFYKNAHRAHDDAQNSM